MAKRQLQIAGTERITHPDIESAAEAYREVRDERAAMSKRETQKRLELLAIMKANKVKRYKFEDDNGEELEAYIEEPDPKAGVRKTGEAEPQIGEGIESSGEPSTNGVHPGLIDMAMKAQQDEAHAEVDSEGNVVVPETAAKKRGKSKKK
jgi:hypothetical protein